MPDVAPITAVLPWFSIVLPVLAGLCGAHVLRRPPRSGRPDLIAAVSTGVVIALVAGGIATLLIGGLSGMFGGSPNYGLGLMWGAALAALTFLSSLGGYAFLARPGVGARALTGVILGPLVLIGGPLLMTGAAGAVTNTIAADQARAERAARSDGLRLVVSDVETTLRSAGTVARVDLTVTVEATRRYEVNVNPYDGGPGFFLHPAADRSGVGLFVAEPYGGPISYEPGVPTRYDLVFSADSYTYLSPGTWQLDMTFIDFTGLEYLVEATVDVRPAGG